MAAKRQLSFNEPRATYDAEPPDVLSITSPRTARAWQTLHNTLPMAELRALSPHSPLPTKDSSLPFAPLISAAPDYPEGLRTLPAFPPVLWYRGDLHLLGRQAIGLCGSRKASAQGLRVAAAIGEEAAHTSRVLVTGLARGVDREAMQAALAAGGAAIGVLAEGWERWTARWLDPAITSGQLLVLSEFRPAAPWRSGQAMQRNTTIVRLSKQMYLIEAGTRGGTLDAGRRTLRNGHPLFVLDTGLWTAGNESLTLEGGHRTVWRTGLIDEV